MEAAHEIMVREQRVEQLRLIDALFSVMGVFWGDDRTRQNALTHIHDLERSVKLPAPKADFWAATSEGELEYKIKSIGGQYDPGE